MRNRFKARWLAIAFLAVASMAVVGSRPAAAGNCWECDEIAGNGGGNWEAWDSTGNGFYGYGTADGGFAFGGVQPDGHGFFCTAPPYVYDPDTGTFFTVEECTFW
jgi:hypothetical protein